MEKLKKNLKWIILAVCSITFIVIMCAVIKFQILPIDALMIDVIVNDIRNAWLTSFFKVLTFFGEAKLLILAGGIGALIGFFIIK